MEKTDKRVLTLMIEKIDRICEVVNKNTKQTIESDYTLVDTLMYEFEKLYEDCTRLSAELLIEHPEIPINELRSIRNRVAHDYESVVLDILIDTALNDIPKFKASIAEVIKKEKKQ